VCGAAVLWSTTISWCVLPPRARIILRPFIVYRLSSSACRKRVRCSQVRTRVCVLHKERKNRPLKGTYLRGVHAARNGCESTRDKQTGKKNRKKISKKTRKDTKRNCCARLRTRFRSKCQHVCTRLRAQT